MPHAWTLIRTDPGPGSGISRSTISRGAFGWVTWTARILGITPPIRSWHESSQNLTSPHVNSENFRRTRVSGHHLRGEDHLHVLARPVAGRVPKRLAKVPRICQELACRLGAEMRDSSRDNQSLFGDRIHDS